MWLVPVVVLLTLVISRKAGTGTHATSLFLAATVSLAFVAGVYVLCQLPTVYMFSAGLVLSIFSGNWQTLGLPGFPFLPDRFLLLGSVLLLAVRERDQLKSFRLRPAHVLLMLTAIYATVSAAVAGSLGHRTPTFLLLDQLGLIPFSIFFVVPLIVRSDRDRRVLLFVLLALGIYLGIEALLEGVGANSLVFPRYIVDPNVGTVDGRARGPFTAPVTEGLALFGCAVAAAVILSTKPSRPIRMIARAVIPLCLLGCFFTLERGIWIGVVLSAFAVGVGTRELRRTLLPVLFVGAALVVGSVSFVPGLQQRVTHRTQTSLSVWDRQNQDAAAFRMIKARPLFGFGWSTFTDVSLPYFRQAASYPMTGFNVALHDVYLSNAVELGLVGLLLWLLAQIYAFGTALAGRAPPEMRPWKIGLVAMIILVAVVGVVNPLEQNFAQLLLWTWAGVIVGATWNYSTGSRRVGGEAIGAAAGAAPPSPGRSFRPVTRPRRPPIVRPRTAVVVVGGTVVAAAVGLALGLGRGGGSSHIAVNQNPSGGVISPGPNAAYAASLDRVIGRLNAVRSSAGAQLHRAHDAHAQAAAANGLASAHFQAALALLHLNAGVATTENATLIAALRTTGDAYAALARAAAGNDSHGYSQATVALGHANDALNSALARLRSLGYLVG